jgi:hypothetical protein
LYATILASAEHPKMRAIQVAVNVMKELLVARQ